MCIVFVAFEEHPLYSLIVASNRDEEYDRPASPCGWWDANGPHNGILAGRDHRKGGTWLGVHARNGVWATVTNVREAGSDDESLSRGHLVLQLLAGGGIGEVGRGAPGVACTSAGARSMVAQALATAPSYGGLNALVGGGGELFWLTNRALRAGFDPDAPHVAGTPHVELGRECRAERLGPGVHVVSNALLDTPWPKVTRGRALFRSVLEADAARGGPASAQSRRRLAVELLATVLSDVCRPPASELPRTTGHTLEEEALFSSICVSQRAEERRGAGYGTVAQSVLLVGRDGRAMLTERQMRDGKPLGAPSLFEFAFSAPPPRGFLGTAVSSRSRHAQARAWALGLAVSSAACVGLATLARARRS
ncbi:hypothetical protein KFE25_006193 [Diacronema lutheri]|uniref:Uncharacterized protein n=2 Tax=Diacronema lutheri TaxID=2081491 RepID=A0A8J5XQE9_DIALT|nr:hypothetical protein KFE25_006193 [Diacronema lutheri]